MDEGNFFKAYFDNASVNSILIMNSDGEIIKVNDAFTKHFDYSTEDLKGKNFSELFVTADRDNNKPEAELKEVLATGQANDECFIVNKAGHALWCTGEAMLATDANNDRYIIKDVINLQSKENLQLFLNNTEDLLDRMFHASTNIPMMILDGAIRIWDVNAAFLKFFNIQKQPGVNVNLSNLQSTFWNQKEIRNDLSRVVVTNTSLRKKQYIYETSEGNKKTISMDAKIIFMQPEGGRRIYILIDEV